MFRVSVLAGLMLLSAISARAQAVDCNAVKSTRMPVQLMIKTGEPEYIEEGDRSPSAMANREYVYQLYRNDDGFLIIYASEADTVTKFIYEHGFLSSVKVQKNGAPDFEQEYKYEQKADYDLKAKGLNFKTVAKAFRKSDGKSELIHTIEQEFRFVNSDGIVIGPCRFRVNVYEISQRTISPNGDAIILPRKTTVQYSPDLGFSLSQQFPLLRNNVAYALMTRRAVGIDTLFVPIKER